MISCTYISGLFSNPVAGQKARIIVSSPISLMDEPISIEIEDLKPFQKAKIQAEIIDDNGERWNSWALFQADKNGFISIPTQIPITGTYERADGMGLFWSMKPTSNRFASFKKKGDLEVELSLIINEQLVAHHSIQRLRKLGEVKQIDVREDGLVASLFIPPSNDPLPVIITLSGSNGGLGENRAKLLASHGFSVLALGYFGVEGLPPTLENIPIEYFQKAFNWLEHRKDIQGNCIGLYGASRGAELALILGSIFPNKIQAIVATVPSNVVFAGLGNKRTPAWLYQGKPVGPDAPVPLTDTSNGRGQTPEYPIATTLDFLKGLNDHPNEFFEAEIPVEKIKSPLLLISGGDDQMWPSSLFSQKIMNRLEQKNSLITRTHLEYPLAGHLINIPFLPSESIYYHPHGKLWFSMGGSATEDDLASRDSWEKLIKFFKLNLCQNFEIDKPEESSITCDPMKTAFQIIYINGPSSSGKTTLAKSIQQEFEQPFLHIGIDRIIGMMPNKINNWEGGTALEGFSWKQTYDETGHPVHDIQMGPFAKKISQTLKKIVLTMAKEGHYIIIDDVAFGKSDVDAWREILKDYKVLWIGIKSPLPLLEEREKSRGDRIVGSARAQYFKVHNDVVYDLEFDVSRSSLEDIVKDIKQKICVEKNR